MWSICSRLSLPAVEREVIQKRALSSLKLPPDSVSDASSDSSLPTAFFAERAAARAGGRAGAPLRPAVRGAAFLAAAGATFARGASVA